VARRSGAPRRTLALALGDHAVAVDFLDDAVRQADQAGAIFEAVMARRLLATTLLTQAVAASAHGATDDIIGLVSSQVSSQVASQVASQVTVARPPAAQHGSARELALLDELSASSAGRP